MIVVVVVVVVVVVGLGRAVVVETGVKASDPSLDGVEGGLAHSGCSITSTYNKIPSNIPTY